MAKEKETKKDLSSVLTGIRKSYGSIMPDPKEAGSIKRLILSDPGLNRIYGGGFALGRIHELFGPPSGGKTVLANYIGGDFQRRKDGPPLVVFVDMEHTFDEKYARNVGLDIDNPLTFQLIRPLYGEQAFDVCQQLVETGEVGLITWDSVASTPTASQSTDEYGKASFGGAAKLFSEGLRKFNPYLSHYGTSLLLINQVRDQIGGLVMPGMPKPETQPGGQAIKFYDSTRNRVSQGAPIIHLGEQIGNVIKIKNQKNKTGVPKRSTEMELTYASGFNPDRAYVDFIVKLGIVDVKGSYYTKEAWGMKTQHGQDQLFNWLIGHRDEFEVAKSLVNESFMSYNALDIGDTEADPETEREAEGLPGAGTEE